MEQDQQTWTGRYGVIYRFVRQRTASREDAEDITQDVFAAAATALTDARLSSNTPPLAWLYTVARRRLIDRLRTGSSQRAVAEWDPADLAGPEEADYGQPLARTLLAALRQLDRPQREVVVMKLFEGRRFAEIAATTATSEEACRMRFSRGLKELRRSLEEKGVTP
jgi:RNA polymerase sigma-70 factor, ECF subfamily